MLHSIISSVRPLFHRYSYGIYGGKYKIVLYFRPTTKRDFFRITLTLNDNDAIDFYYETIGFTEATTRYSKESAIDLLTHYIKSSLNLKHNL